MRWVVKLLRLYCNQTDVLEITDSQLLDVRCFQEANGSITLLVAGVPSATNEYQYMARDLNRDEKDIEDVTNSWTKTDFRAGLILYWLLIQMMYN